MNRLSATSPAATMRPSQVPGVPLQSRPRFAANELLKSAPCLSAHKYFAPSGRKRSHCNMFPFTDAQFLDVFARYNTSVWPAQLFLYAVGILAISLTLQRKGDFSKIVSLVLAILWIWMGLVYHWWFFSTINPAALIFALFFVVQGVLFFFAGVWKNDLGFGVQTWTNQRSETRASGRVTSSADSGLLIADYGLFRPLRTFKSAFRNPIARVATAPGSATYPALSVNSKPHRILNFPGIPGGMFLIYALVIYPALGYWLGHRYPAAPTFGLPCPTTIFTFGMLLWTNRRVPLYLLPIPFAWSLIGISAAMSLGMTEDYGLLVAGLVGASLIILRDTQAAVMLHRPMCGTTKP